MNNKNRSKSNFSKNSNETLEKMNDEFFHINNYLKELNLQIDNNCLYQKEKENFNFLKKENIKMLSDVSIMKDDIKDLILKFKNLNDKINEMQKQNEIIKNQNKNLINFIENNKNNQTENFITNESFNFNKNNQIISNLSVFNNFQSKNLNLNTYSDFSNNILNTNNFINNYENENENKNFENKNFNLIELNNNINSILHKNNNNNNNEKRFLIKKI
jgi:TolA-binding protein